MTVIHRVSAIYRAVIYRFDCMRRFSFETTIFVEKLCCSVFTDGMVTGQSAQDFRSELQNPRFPCFFTAQNSPATRPEAKPHKYHGPLLFRKMLS